jgi:predicted RNA-binding Zn-ribbon protein involved in translation (DUF1610 family)
MGSETNFAERYAAMSETELMKLARGYDDLVDEAQTALRNEFARRGLEPPIIEEEEPLPTDDATRLVTVAEYPDLAEGLLARTVLEEAKIACFLSDESTVSLANVAGGAKLQVAAEDEAAAREVLSQPFATYSGEGFVQPVCPQCGSTDVIANDHQRTAREATWRCMECDSTWLDDEELAGRDGALG